MGGNLDPLVIVTVLVGLSLAPFIAMMVTSFVKIVVVMSLIRNALGVQQIPPNLVMNGLAVILSLYIMAPVVEETFEIVQKNELNLKEMQSIRQTVDVSKEPLKKFLVKHTRKEERQFFLKSAKKLWPEEKALAAKDDDMMVLIPAFTVSELTTAFQIGFLIYLPFIVIDLIVSNILLAMGMMMVSPTTISLPFKLLLFVLVDGWTRLIHGLVLSYS